MRSREVKQQRPSPRRTWGPESASPGLPARLNTAPQGLPFPPLLISRSQPKHPFFWWDLPARTPALGRVGATPGVVLGVGVGRVAPPAGTVLLVQLLAFWPWTVPSPGHTTILKIVTISPALGAVTGQNWSLILKIHIGTSLVVHGASLIAQLVKNPPAMQETPVRFLVGKIHWRRDRLPTPIFLGSPRGSAGKEYACKAGDLA